MARCTWADTHPLLQKYHDKHWGVPVHDDKVLFMLSCNGMYVVWIVMAVDAEKARKRFVIALLISTLSRWLASLPPMFSTFLIPRIC